MYLVRQARLLSISELSSSLAIICTLILIIPTTSNNCKTITTSSPRTSNNWDPYRILDVKHDATMEEIAKAHSNLLEKSRTDGNSEIGKRLQDIQRAYEYLRLQHVGKQNNLHNHNHQQQQYHDHRRYQQRIALRNYEVASPTKSTTTNESEKEFGLAARVVWRVVTYSIRFMNYCTALEFTSSIMLFFVGFCTLLLISRKWKSPQQTASTSAPSEDSSSNNSTNITTERKQDDQSEHYLAMKIIELHLETYNGMVRLSSPGHRTIVLLCDQDSKDKLLGQFKKAVWPYRKNKILLFGYLCLDKNLDWYRSMLEQVLGVDSLSLQKKYCIGTVLSLNGYKRYFRLYHAKHRESIYQQFDDDEEELREDFNSCELTGVFSSLSADKDLANGQSGGKSLDDGLLSESNFNNCPGKVVYIVDNLLDQLPEWLDKMFVGLTKKYPLDKWPDDMR